MKIKSLISTLTLIIALITGNFRLAFGGIDVGVTAIIQPTCSVVPGVPTSVIVVITNFGTITMTTLDIGCLIGGSVPNVATWNGMLTPATSDTFEFPVAFIFPGGPFSFCSYTMSIDTFPANDTTCISCNGSPMSINAEQENSKNKIIVYPNPTSGIFILKMENYIDNQTSITITDILGKEVWKSDMLKPEFNVDLTGEPKGVYQINIITSSAVTNTKLFLVK